MLKKVTEEEFNQLCWRIDNGHELDRMDYLEQEINRRMRKVMLVVDQA